MRPILLTIAITALLTITQSANQAATQSATQSASQTTAQAAAPFANQSANQSVAQSAMQTSSQSHKDRSAMQTSPQSHKDRSADIQNILQQYNLPGIQLIYTHGKHTETYNLGTTGDSSHPVTSNTIFEAASLSKCIFTYIVLRLYDRELINLDTSLLAYLGTYDRFDPNDPAYKKITARMVLTHRTGLPNWGDSDRAGLIFPPDSTWSYSGEGFVYLQHVIEKITGKSLDELAKAEVFTPLKMTSSSYTWQPRFDSVSAFGNSPQAIKDHSRANAAYSLLTNAHDYMLFLKAIASGQGLKPETHKMMLTPATQAVWFDHKYTDATRYIYWGLGVGLVENNPYIFDTTPSPAHGRLAWYSNPRGAAFWHWGDNGDFKAYYIVYPKTQEYLIFFVHHWRGLFATQDLYNLFIENTPCWSILWSGEGYHSPRAMKMFTTAVETQGFDKAADIQKNFLKTQGIYPPEEDDLNEYGFLLMNKKRPQDAVAIFKLNLSLHPKSANAFDSLGEGYEALGEKGLALENFKHSLDLNPRNDYAAKHIKDLQTSLQNK